MNNDLNQILDIKNNDVVAIIGSGGKTNLAYNLSKINQDKITVLTTTTKMFIIKKDDINASVNENYNKFISPTKGINIFGNIYENKIQPLDNDKMQNLIKESELFIYEADGSKMLPLKAWNDKEPVILENTTKCVGVLPLHILNHKVSPEIIHRYDLFLDKFSVKEGQIIDEALIVKICNEMFCKIDNKIEKFIFFNRTLDTINATKISKLLKKYKIFIGDLFKDKYIKINF
ncbi:selenium cofactor biosynthesis protein YqeC [Campylobacter sp. MG1]|uniref:selenium cofactor biosynthesis protein YqeC n=1 Tax=Campylobacter sp. MG1 TaxID=2976332 RepID=UPI00226C68AB|nr:selenium cofactor biosynthesis protein YqeC [Campylobacter sp. MG1]